MNTKHVHAGVPSQGGGTQGESDEVIVIPVGGGIRGPALLDEAVKLCAESSGKARVGGVVLDKWKTSRQKGRVRYAWYPQFDEYEDSMRSAAVSHDLPYFWDSISKQFMPDCRGYSAFERWLYHYALQRELGNDKGLRLLFLMACFPQRWGKSTIKLANGWFVNTHAVGSGSLWEGNPCCGPVPYEMMYRLGIPKCDLVAHLIDNTFDGGTEICRVGPYDRAPYSGRGISISREDGEIKKNPAQGDYVLEMHKRMAVPTKVLIRKFFAPMLEEILAGHRPCLSVVSRIKSKLVSIS